MKGTAMREEILKYAAPGHLAVGDNAAHLPLNSMAIEYSCPICGETFMSEEEAKDCRDQTYDTGGLEVGDIVVVPSGYRSGIPEDDPWLAFIIPPNPNSASHFERAGYKVPYFVVTAIHTDSPHRCVVTLCSFAGGRLRCGWNPANGDGHYAMYRWDNDNHCAVRSTWLEKIRDLLDNCEPCDIVKREAAELASMRISATYLL
jgi:hypothetical protein